jgi:bacterioferritin-associated ferredoxin
MIVCHCTGLTDREIRARATRPGFRPEDILSDLDTGWTCGGCGELVRKVLAESQLGSGEAARSPRPAPPAPTRG